MKNNFPTRSSDEDQKLCESSRWIERERHLNEMLEWYMREIRGIKDYVAYTGRKIPSHSAKSISDYTRYTKFKKKSDYY